MDKVDNLNNPINCYQLQKLDELQLANRSNVFIFSRDKFTSNLPKKLKNEFQKVFVSTEYKDCQRILHRITNESIDQDSSNRIDLIIADADPLTIKLFDYVNKRPLLPETSTCPLIPTVVLTNENTDQDFLNNLSAVGGANRILKTPCSSKEVLFAVIELLRRCKLVEETYRDLKKQQILTNKYPHIDIFDTVSHRRNDATSVDNNNGSKRMDPSEVSLQSSSDFDNRVEDIEEGTECSSLLPMFVKKSRQLHGDDSNGVNDSSSNLHLNANDGIVPEKQNKTLSNRPSRRSEILKNRNKINSKINAVPDKQLLKLSIQQVKVHNNSTEPLRNSSQSEIKSQPDDQYIDEEDEADVANTPLIENERKSPNLPASSPGIQPQKLPTFTETYERGYSTQSEAIHPYLNPSYRPVWKDSNKYNLSEDIRRKSLLNQIQSSSNNTDMYPFVNRPIPKLVVALSIGGLEKKAADQCWNILLPKSAGTTTKLEATSTDLGDSIKDDVNSKRSLFGESSATTGRSSAELTLAQNTALNSSRPLARAMDQLQSHVQLLTSDRKASVHAANHAKQVNSLIKKTEKMISALAKDTPPDLQISSNLIEIDFSNRKINLGERNMLEKGKKFELEGDIAEATICFTSSGTHSKDQQISKMLLGNLSFKTGKLLTALNHYNHAMNILDSKRGSARLIQDEFLAHHNRSIINFRLGNDDQGMKDLEIAVSLNPSHLESHELLALTRRRAGKYSSSIQETLLNKAMRNDKRKEQLFETVNMLKPKEHISVTVSQDVRNQSMDLDRKKSTLMKTIPAFSAELRAAGTQNLADSGANLGFKRHGVIHPQLVKVGMSGSHIDLNLSGKSKLGSMGYDDAIDRGGHHHMHRGCMLDISESKCHQSLRDRIAAARITAINTENTGGDDEEVSSGGFLKYFKVNNGLKMELFDEIFLKPSELQNALLVHPSRRLPHHLNIITTFLRLFPFLRSSSESQIVDLASVVEYRALSSKDKLFNQNLASEAVFFLLSGSVQIRMDLKTSNSDIEDYLVVGKVNRYETFGHIDFLFRHRNIAIIKELENIFYPKVYLGSVSVGFQEDGVNKNINGTNFKDLKPGSRLEEGELNQPSFLNNMHHEINGNSKIEKEMSGGEILNQLLDAKDNEVDRAISSGMFMSYAMQSLCELLIIGERDFERLLLKPAIEELRKRYEVLQSSGIFKGWSTNQLIRLSRMAQLQTINRGDLILFQGIKPDYLYFIVKGMCRVFKKPNRTEMLLQKLNIAKEKAERHDLKYAFHHKLVADLTLVKLTEEELLAAEQMILRTSSNTATFATPSATTSSSNIEVGGEETQTEEHYIFHPQINKRAESESLRKHVLNLTDHEHLTAAELVRYNLALEIIKLEALIHRALLQDSKEAKDEGNKQYTAENILNDSKISEIATLQWPMIFGEAAVLDPESGVSRGSIISDTICEVLLLQKTQIQTFNIDDKFLERVKSKSVFYPSDPEIVVKLHRENEWKNYKSNMMTGVQKNRWPKKMVEYEPFIVTN